MSGIGIGLFVDEVGKFITQANDYFFPPAMALIYGFFLLTVFVYLYFRRPRQKDPRSAMYHALDALQDALDGDLDTEEAERIDMQLSVARRSDRQEIASLAKAIGDFLQEERRHLAAAEPDFWKRIAMRTSAFGSRLSQRRHRTIISLILVLWTILAIGFVTVLLLAPSSLESQVVQWRVPLIVIQALVGALMMVATVTWLSGNEGTGLKYAIAAFLLSLVALQSIYFYLSQFQAITVTLIQFAFLLILLAYRNRYSPEGDQNTLSDAAE